MVADPFCDLCGAIETIQHSLVECPEIEAFWRDLMTVMKQRLSSLASKHSFTHIDILFGIVDGRSIVNFLILIAKQFIVSQRYRDGRITVGVFRAFVAKFFAMEKEIARKNDKLTQFRRKWCHFVTVSGELDL